MPVVHHFAHGPIHPVVAYVLAFIGAAISLACTARARRARSRRPRARWLATASFSLGSGIWLMHFTAMLGFDIPDTPVRYDALITLLSAMLSILVVGMGLMVVGSGRHGVGKVIIGGTFTGIGVAIMHYTGMAAMRIAGSVHYDPDIVAASVLVAVVAAIVALWLSVTIEGRGPILTSAAIMALAVCGMHYTAMAAVHVQLNSDGQPVGGIDPIVLILPIMVIATATVVGVVFVALQTMTEEDFTAPTDLRPAAHRRLGPPRPAPLPATAHPVSLAAFNASVPVQPTWRVPGHDGRH